MKPLFVLVLAALLPAALQAQTIVFSDTFTQSDGADADWTSVSGDWVVTDGTYGALSPTNSPPTVALVDDLTFTNGTIEAIVYGSMDGALVVRANGVTDGVVNGVYFIYRDGDTYFHVASGGSVGGMLASVAHVALPMTGYKVSVTVVDDTYIGTISSLDGETVYATTTLTDSTYTSGAVGLYSRYITGSYDNYVVTAVSEPAAAAGWAGLGALMLVLARRRRRAA